MKNSRWAVLLGIGFALLGVVLSLNSYTKIETLTATVISMIFLATYLITDAIERNSKK